MLEVQCYDEVLFSYPLWMTFGMDEVQCLYLYRYAICICAAITAINAKLGYSCAKCRSFSAAIVLSLAQYYCFGLLDN